MTRLRFQRLAITRVRARPATPNGTEFYTSAVAPAFPLIADAALFSAGATLDRVTIVDLP